MTVTRKTILVLAAVLAVGVMADGARAAADAQPAQAIKATTANPTKVVDNPVATHTPWYTPAGRRGMPAPYDLKNRVTGLPPQK